ncbi:tyrosinase family protein [Rhizobiaceae bacterium BDR2-2]|uniref:Tyrosinase family protein n=1 Tax=Ectorhizobium quercum TaxID=2965071 RepID=A0AAE3N5D5_9HYPH|nr:tyrosinase family protein [Ectorhizobium quercum]MCX9000004.1 tyrosinase family protein [Ectorhizobium quercum]
MSRTRRSVWADGPDWNETLLWYAKAVGILQVRAATDRTSWRFFAGIHGHNEETWRLFGILRPEDKLPERHELDLFWDKCQHGSWYFLPWHRGCVSAFEQLVRSVIAAEGGPDDWALPYWNYSETSNPHAREVHPAFLAETTPDGAPNPLYTPFRFGNPITDSTTVPEEDVDLEALRERKFAPLGEVAGGFGGGRSILSHRAGFPGALEIARHGGVHTAVGGAARLQDGTIVRGLMSAFETAGLDPIFWLHHANIDRLWAVWLSNSPNHTNPTETNWLGGPLDRPFVMPRPDGSAWHYSCIDVVDTSNPMLDYVYDDTSDPLVAIAGAAEGRTADRIEEGRRERDTELIGTNGTEIKLGTGPTTSEVTVDEQVLRSQSERLVQENRGADQLSGLYLNLENIRGLNNVAIYQVLVDYGEVGARLLSGEPRVVSVGRFSTFGLDESSSDGINVSSGVTMSFDLTPLIAQIGFDEVPEKGLLRVSIVPQFAAPELPAPTIGRINIYQGVP